MTATMSWCSDCNSYHAEPRDREHHAQLQCQSPWTEYAGLDDVDKFRNAPIRPPYINEVRRSYVWLRDNWQDGNVWVSSDWYLTAVEHDGDRYVRLVYDDGFGYANVYAAHVEAFSPRRAQRNAVEYRNR